MIMTPTLLTADRCIYQGKTLVGGILVLPSADGGDVTLYDGTNSDSGTKKIPLEGLAHGQPPILFPHPLIFERGLYVDVGSNITSVTILWTPFEPSFKEVLSG